MAVCSRCGTALIATARFCAACGSPVSLGTTPRPPTAPMSATPNPVNPSPSPAPVGGGAPPPGAAQPPVPGAAPSAPDPYARTVMGDPAAVANAIAAATAAAAAAGAPGAAGARTSEPRMPTAPLAQVNIAPARPNPVSPMASSVMRTPGDPNAKPASATPWNVPASVPNPYAPTRPPPPVAPAMNPMGSIAPGSMVLVHWSDGNRYPGTVLQSAGGQLLVAFPNGQQQWVNAKYVSVGA